jgi:pyrimidine oxygenase
VKLGIFMPTMNNGWVVSKASPQWDPSWFLAQDCALKAEHYGFDFLLSAVKLRGFDGETGFWNRTLDSLSVMAGLAVTTKRIKLYGSIPTLLAPPAVVAKQAVTIAEMSGGRFGLNIVTGWEKPEYTQLGEWPGDQHFETRYDHAAEFVTIMKELWEQGRSDFKGDYFQLDDCMLGPTPPEPIELVCAGQSDRGMRFTAEHCDYLFIQGPPEVDLLTETNRRLKGFATETGRDVGSLPNYMIVLRDSVEEAEAEVQRWRDNADIEGLETMTGIAKQDMTADERSSARVNLTGSAALVIGTGLVCGDAETVAAKLQALSEVDGTRGLMLTFQDYLVDVDRFGREVMPLLRRDAVAA